MKDEWQDPGFAAAWDQSALVNHPTETYHIIFSVQAFLHLAHQALMPLACIST